MSNVKPIRTQAYWESADVWAFLWEQGDLSGEMVEVLIRYTAGELDQEHLLTAIEQYLGTARQRKLDRETDEGLRRREHSELGPGVA